MNDDTVPDVGMTIGFDKAESPSHCRGKYLMSTFALSALRARAEVDLVSGIVTWRDLMGERVCNTVCTLRIDPCMAE
jgi:hypothetical protein